MVIEKNTKKKNDCGTQGQGQGWRQKSESRQPTMTGNDQTEPKRL